MKERSLKQRLISALLVLVMTFTSLVGTTFAWFTDSVTSVGNRIESGTLKIDLLHKDGDKWVSLKENEDHLVFDYDKWEPGFTAIETLDVKNLGSLALKYKLSIEVEAGTAKLGKNGEDLADVIDVWVYYGETNVSAYSAITAANSGWVKKGTLADVLSKPGEFINGNLLSTGNVSTNAGVGVGNQIVNIALHMQESAGNEYQKLSVGNIYVNLVATQLTSESDSFGNDYDSGADFPTFSGSYIASAPVELDSENKSVDDVMLLSADGTISAVVPAGTLLKPGTTKVTLNVTTLDKSESNVVANENQNLNSIDVHVAEVDEGNTTPVIVTIEKLLAPGLNIGNYDLYHVEGGVTNVMTYAATESELDVHNEFVYDPATGDVKVAMASFSEVVARADKESAWKGNRDYSWYDANATELYIANADQLAGLSAIVGNMAEGIEQDSFGGKTVTLLADLDLGDKESENNPDIIFYPIGYWNNEGTYERLPADQRVTAVESGFYNFCGTFDGNGHTVSNFYQNTWEMKGDHNWYDPIKEQYYRDGMGLFGKIYGGTVKNLTVTNFSSDGEITTTGTIAAYAEGATFENIAIFDCNPRVYNIGNGGIVGCVGWYAKEANLKTTFKNITVDNSNKISALWGSYDVPCGGILGQYYPTSGQSSADYPLNGGLYFENCHVSAQLDVYNDVCANYQYYAYRYAGMLIGSVRENVTIDGHSYPKMDGITAKDCTVHFGDWNDYYYCELVANSLASYTHDHQMSRLAQIEKINVEAKKYLPLGMEDKAENWVAIPESGRQNYVVVKAKGDDGKWKHGDGHDYAECYHFVDGVQHFHDVADSDNPNVNEIVNGVEVLKEDKQLVYREFENLVTGYGWGVTSRGFHNLDGVTNLDIGQGNQEASVEKFEGKVNVNELENKTTYKFGDIFSFVDRGVELKLDALSVSVHNLDENNPVSATIVYDRDNWANGTITFTGVGEVNITIQDYYFCTPTTINVTVREHDHLYDNDCDVDCNECGATREVGEHVYDNDCDVDCNECGATREVGEHVYDNDCDVDCNECGAERTPKHTAGKEADCVTAQKCTVCGVILKAALGHKEVIDEAVDATCTTTGLTEGKHCSVCNTVLVAQTAVEKLAHNTVIDAAVAPTCTATGLTEGKHCSVCNEVLLAQTVVDKLPHTPGTEADCENAQTCTVCGVILNAALGHIEKKFTGDFLYRVGNQNAVELSSLFNVKNHSVRVEGTNVVGNASVTINGTSLKFNGTGVVKITLTVASACVECQAKLELMLEVVDAHNIVANANGDINSYTGTNGGSNVLLEDVDIANNGTLWLVNGTLYGNGFEIDARDAAYSGVDMGYKSYVINLSNYNLDNVKIIGKVYSTVGGTHENDYHRPLINASTGDCTIANCYLAYTASPIRTGANLEIINTTVEGGTYANIDVRGGKLILDNVTTINQIGVNEQGPVGLGIVVYQEGGEDSTTITIKNRLTQYNFLSQDQANNMPDGYSKGIAEQIFKIAADTYQYDDGTTKWVNTGIISMNNLFDKDDIIDLRDDKNNYVTHSQSVTLSMQTRNCVVYSAKPTSITKPTGSYVSAGQHYIKPIAVPDNSVNNAEKVEGSNDYCYIDGNTVYIAMDEGDTFNWDTSILVATKYGNVLPYTVKMNDVDYTGKSIAFNTSGTYTVEYTYIDSYNYTLENGDILSYNKEYTKIITIEVAVVEAAAKHAEFSFGTNGTAYSSKTVIIDGKTYVMPDVTATVDGKIGSTTVNGVTVYYPITEMYTSDGKTAHTGSWYACFPIFKNALQIVDYADKGTGDPIKYNQTTVTTTNGIPSTLKATDPKSAFLYQMKAADYPPPTEPTAVSEAVCYTSNRNGLTASNTRKELNITAEYTYTDNAGTVYYYYIGYHCPEQTKGSTPPCVTPDTLVTLADGTQVRVDALTGTEELLVWNHETGKLDKAPVAYIVDHEGVVAEVEVIHMTFTNGSTLKIIGEHVFFDVTLNKYIAIDSDNVDSFIGHTFVALGEDGNSVERVELVSVNREIIETETYEVVSYKHLNCFTEGILSTSAYLDPLLNIFDIDSETLAYDAESVQSDIETYGLYTYADFEGLISEEAFELYNAAYLKIAVGKGYITWDDVLELIDIYFNVGVNPIEE